MKGAAAVTEGGSVSFNDSLGGQLDGSLADEVARAASGMTNMTLARLAGMSTRTLRAILDPSSERRLGRATLDTLDNALGWDDGSAWSIYRTNCAAHHHDGRSRTATRLSRSRHRSRFSPHVSPN